MSRTYRNQPPTYCTPYRLPKTHNELKQQSFDDDGYTVKTRHRYVPTAWDDRCSSAHFQSDYNQ